MAGLDVRDFGARGDGTTDDTAAIQAALDASAAASSDRRAYPPVHLPHGIYCAHEVQWNDMTPVSGDGMGMTVLRYNGAGGPESAIIQNPKDGGATPYTGFTGLTLDGNGVAEHGYKVTGSTGTDFGFRFEDCHILNTAGDALSFTGGTIVNIHLDRLRFDRIGGYLFHFRGSRGDERRPVSISRFTWDTGGTGKGVARLEDCFGVHFLFRDARIECNNQLTSDAGTRQWFYATSSRPEGTWLVLDNVHGYVQPGDSAAVIRDADGRLQWSLDRCELGAFTAAYRNDRGVTVPTTAGQYVGKVSNGDLGPIYGKVVTQGLEVVQGGGGTASAFRFETGGANHTTLVLRHVPTGRVLWSISSL